MKSTNHEILIDGPCCLLTPPPWSFEIRNPGQHRIWVNLIRRSVQPPPRQRLRLAGYKIFQP